MKLLNNSRTVLYFVLLSLLFLVALAILFSPFLVTSQSLYEWTMDDAYINFRFAKNFVSGHGITWNVSSSPFEGFTSWLLFAFAGVFISLGIPPAPGIKVLSLMVLLAVVLWLALKGLTEEESVFHLTVRLFAVAGLVTSPQILVHTISGKETLLGGALAFLAAVFFIHDPRTFSPRRLVALNLTILVGFFARPEFILFGFFLLASLFIFYLFNKELRNCLRLIWLSFLCSGLPLLVFYLWKWIYFGEIFPTPAFVKSNSDLVNSRAASMLADFFVGGVFVYLILGLFFLLLKKTETDNSSYTYFALLVSILLSEIFFLGVTPIQGFLWRYLLLYYPAIIYFFYKSALSLDVESPFTNFAPLVLVLIVAFLVGKNLVYTQSATKVIGRKWQSDRVLVGKMLSRVEGNNLRMFVSEAGALSYFSGWQTKDAWGLTDKEIAAEGLSKKHIGRFNPDLIALLGTKSKKGRIFIRDKNRQTAWKYAQDNDFVPGAILCRSNPDLKSSCYRIHIYMINPQSSSYEAIGEKLEMAKKRIPSLPTSQLFNENN